MEKIGSDNWENLGVNEINNVVGHLVDELNLNGGSTGEMDLFVVTRHYLKNEKVRNEINIVLSDNQCY